jgi:predicted nucleotidyltransferase
MNIDQELHAALARIVRTLEASERGYCVIGALVPRLLMITPPTQRTRDVDVVVAATSLNDVEELTRTLLSAGYSSVAPPVRFRDESGVQVDVIPFGDALVSDDRLVLPGETVLRTEGLRQALAHAVRLDLAPGLQVAVAPLPLYAMLKLSAYADRRKAKDLNGFLHCARYYEDVEAGERRYGLEHQGSLVPLESGGAFLLGLDGVLYQSRELHDKLWRLLGSFQNDEASGLGEAARDAGRPGNPETSTLARHLPDRGHPLLRALVTPWGMRPHRTLP